MLLLFLGATLLASIIPGPVVLLTIAVALAGLLTVLISHRVLFQGLQVAGALYLVYLGLRMVWSGWRAAAVIAVDTRPHERPYFDGLVTQLSNPKAILLFDPFGIKGRLTT